MSGVREGLGGGAVCERRREVEVRGEERCEGGGGEGGGMMGDEDEAEEVNVREQPAK
jgi:hypothetical protein